MKWKLAYDEAEREGKELPSVPLTQTTCCGVAEAIYPPIHLREEYELPRLEEGQERFTNTDIGAMLRLCNKIGKSPHSIRRCRNYGTRTLHSHRGDYIYFIDVKAKHVKGRIHALFEGQLKGGNTIMYSITAHRRKGDTTEEEDALTFLEGCFGEEEFSLDDAADALVDGELTDDRDKAYQMAKQLASKGYIS